MRQQTIEALDSHSGCAKVRIVTPYLIPPHSIGGNCVGNAPKEDNLSMAEWTRLKASPYDERLQLTEFRETSANSRHPWDTVTGASLKAGSSNGSHSGQTS